MGLFLGMSVLTVIETVMYLSKIMWIIVSKKRREYLHEKKRKEDEKERAIEEKINHIRTTTFQALSGIAGLSAGTASVGAARNGLSLALRSLQMG